MLIAGSISRFIKIIGVKEPTNDATETANTIPVPTTNPINGSVFKSRKNPVVIGDSDTKWGYVTTRVYFAMIEEALAVVHQGIATREEVDQLMTDCFRWPSGPFGMTRGATSGWK